MRPGSTSLQRTYRYLRIAIVGAVVVVFTAIATTLPVVGILPSISHYYYSPANTLFVGALIAVSVSLFALSGRGAERVLLDAAATIAPLVAIVPTAVSPGSIAGADAACPGDRRTCVPEEYAAAVDSGVMTYLIVGAAVVILAAALTVAGEVDRRGAAVSIVISLPVLLVVGLTWGFARTAFLAWAHVASASLFFLLIAAVAVRTAIAPRAPGAPPWLRRAYIAIAVAIAVLVAGMPLYGALHAGRVYGVFVGEVLALVLFAGFWILQSVQYWHADDPAIIGPRAPQSG
ncbi:MAG: hypothetical protein J0I43_11155 [Microbacterium sp.]|uniref:hypothetical protein n=1 Tax=Microbacterium sp. TaxID=51671 RepID=UPI001AC1C76A|nr:hypothetical protein [Microbacterium sp.]MBN9177911.1 hypothetical protein [Microbacterium sp.]